MVEMCVEAGGKEGKTLVKTFLALRNSHRERVPVLFHKDVMPGSIVVILWV